MIRDIFKNPGLFKSSTVFRYMSDILYKVLGKKFQAMIISAGRYFLGHFRCLAEFQMHLCIYKCYIACIVILGSASAIFRHIPALFKSMITHIQNLVYPWHIQNPGIFLLQIILRLQGIFLIPY